MRDALIPGGQKFFPSLVGSTAAAPPVGWCFILLERPPVSRPSVSTLLPFSVVLFTVGDAGPRGCFQEERIVCQKALCEQITRLKIMRLTKQTLKEMKSLILVFLALNGCCFLLPDRPVGA